MPFRLNQSETVRMYVCVRVYVCVCGYVCIYLNLLRFSTEADTLVQECTIECARLQL